MLQRKHLEELAALVKSYNGPGKLDIIAHFARNLIDNNPNFKADKFVNACMGNNRNRCEHTTKAS